MPERWPKRCSTVTRSSTSGRSVPSSSRAGVARGSVPSAASDNTTSAVNPFDPLAMASRVSTVIGIWCARCAQPVARSSTVPPARSTRITPEKWPSAIRLSTRAARSSTPTCVDNTQPRETQDARPRRTCDSSRDSNPAVMPPAEDGRPGLSHQGRGPPRTQIDHLPGPAEQRVYARLQRHAYARQRVVAPRRGVKSS